MKSVLQFNLREICSGEACFEKRSNAFFAAKQK